MPFNEFNMCRLCMNTELLENLYKMDGETTLDVKTNSCIEVNVQPGDGLPSAICSPCIKTVNEFFNFKKRCLEVDLKLKTISTNFKELLDSSTNFEITHVEKPNAQPAEYYTELQDIPCTNRQNKNDFVFKLNENVLEVQTTYKMEIKPTKKKINKSSNSYQCELCGRVFKMKAVLETHLTIHSGIKPYICKICPKRFARAENRMIHMRTHMGIKPYVCEICGSSSTKRQDLIRHMKIHSDERKYPCPRCNRQFKRSSDVTSHMRTHTGLRPYKCNTCEKTYTSHSGLRKHYKTHCKRELIDNR